VNAHPPVDRGGLNALNFFLSLHDWSLHFARAVFIFVIPMAFRNTRSRACTAGRSGRESDDLAAALDAAWALEDADDDESFAVIDSGGFEWAPDPGGCR